MRIKRWQMWNLMDYQPERNKEYAAQQWRFQDIQGHLSPRGLTHCRTRCPCCRCRYGFVDTSSHPLARKIECNELSSIVDLLRLLLNPCQHSQRCTAISPCNFAPVQPDRCKRTRWRGRDNRAARRNSQRPRRAALASPAWRPESSNRKTLCN